MIPQPRYQPGDKIGGRYQVHKALMGGMGEVYLCLDLQENYPRALKTFQQRYLSEALSLQRAFEQEVATWVALEKHPNIVRCFWMQSFDNQPFMSLEWIAGEEGRGADLRGWLRRGPLDLKLALEIAIDICRGLVHAQKKQPGLVHRDLKPENVLVAQGGLAKITDFGLVQIVESAGLKIGSTNSLSDSRHSMVANQNVAGTPAYMAPEQWRSEPLDERTDIYALGCILHEMVSGQAAFKSEFSPTTPLQILPWLKSIQTAHESTARPKLPDGHPQALNELLDCCLATEGTARPDSLIRLSNLLTELYEEQFGYPPPRRPAPGAFDEVDLNNRGFTYAELHEYERALMDYGRAIELNPDYALAYCNRGVASNATQEHERSLADFDRAIELDPNNPIFYYNRGVIYAESQSYERALVAYGQAIELDPNNAKVYYNRGVAYYYCATEKIVNGESAGNL